jgi:hypothetical protein
VKIGLVGFLYEGGSEAAERREVSMYRYMMKELLVIVAGLSVCAFMILFFLVHSTPSLQ